MESTVFHTEKLDVCPLVIWCNRLRPPNVMATERESSPQKSTIGPQQKRLKHDEQVFDMRT